MPDRLEIDFAGDAPSPATPVPGARPGGRVTVLADAPPEHMDPTQTYIGTTLAVVTALVHRTLTGYLEDPAGGPRRLVGDLATNGGETRDGGRTWTYTLREGLHYSDGSPVRAQDVAHAVARSFSEHGAFGPQFIQRALDPERTYRGPFTPDANADAPGVTTPDDRTIVFSLPQPHPEFPFLATTTTTTPVPRDRDTRAGYERTWLATGPYRTREHVPHSHYVFERNPHWDPASDPIRHQLPDEFRWEFGVDRQQQTTRLLAPAAGDAAAVATADVAEDHVRAVVADAGLHDRVIAGATVYMQYVYINTRRVTDVDVRRALNLAFDRNVCVELAGGETAAQATNTILAPTVPGYREHDVYAANCSGDPEGARAMLAGKQLRPLTFAFPNTEPNRRVAPRIQAALGRAGFEIILRPVEKSAFYTRMGDARNDSDLIYGVWGPDFPDASGVFDVLLRGDRLTSEGNMNLSYFADAAVTERIDRLSREPDRVAAAAAYGELDRSIMADCAPLIPIYAKRQFTLHGPRVRGLFLSAQYFVPNLTCAHVDPDGDRAEARSEQ